MAVAGLDENVETMEAGENLQDDQVSLKDNLESMKAGKPTRKPIKANGRAVGNQKIDRRLFCKELIKSGMDATAAYKAVSPSVSNATARNNGSRMLAEAGTVKILQPMLARLFSKAGIEADYVFRRWAEMAEASPLDYFHITPDGDLGELDLTDLTQAQRSNLQSIKVTEYMSKGVVTSRTTQVKVLNQQRAIEMIAKHLGLLVDRLAEKDIERIGDIIEKGISRVKASRDLDGWKDIVLDADFTEVR